MFREEEEEVPLTNKPHVAFRIARNSKDNCCSVVHTPPVKRFRRSQAHVWCDDPIEEGSSDIEKPRCKSYMETLLRCKHATRNTTPSAASSSKDAQSDEPARSTPMRASSKIFMNSFWLKKLKVLRKELQREPSIEALRMLIAEIPHDTLSAMFPDKDFALHCNNAQTLDISILLCFVHVFRSFVQHCLS